MKNPMRRKARSWPSQFLCSELVEVRTKADATVANLEAIGEKEAVLLCEELMARGKPVLIKASSRVFRLRVAGCRKDEIALQGLPRAGCVLRTLPVG